MYVHTGQRKRFTRRHVNEHTRVFFFFFILFYRRIFIIGNTITIILLYRLESRWRNSDRVFRGRRMIIVQLYGRHKLQTRKKKSILLGIGLINVDFVVIVVPVRSTGSFGKSIFFHGIYIFFFFAADKHPVLSISGHWPPVAYGSEYKNAYYYYSIFITGARARART